MGGKGQGLTPYMTKVWMTLGMNNSSFVLTSLSFLSFSHFLASEIFKVTKGSHYDEFNQPLPQLVDGQSLPPLVFGPTPPKGRTSRQRRGIATLSHAAPTTRVAMRHPRSKGLQMQNKKALILPVTTRRRIATEAKLYGGGSHNTWDIIPMVQ